MRSMATIHTYDVLDQMYVAVQVKQCDAFENAWETVLLMTATFPGDGESEPSEWLRDCLVGLLERL